MLKLREKKILKLILNFVDTFLCFFLNQFRHIT